MPTSLFLIVVVVFLVTAALAALLVARFKRGSARSKGRSLGHAVSEHAAEAGSVQLGRTGPQLVPPPRDAHGYAQASAPGSAPLGGTTRRLPHPFKLVLVGLVMIVWIAVAVLVGLFYTSKNVAGLTAADTWLLVTVIALPQAAVLVSLIAAGFGARWARMVVLIAYLIAVVGFWTYLVADIAFTLAATAIRPDWALQLLLAGILLWLALEGLLVVGVFRGRKSSRILARLMGLPLIFSPVLTLLLVFGWSARRTGPLLGERWLRAHSQKAALAAAVMAAVGTAAIAFFEWTTDGAASRFPAALILAAIAIAVLLPLGLRLARHASWPSTRRWSYAAGLVVVCALAGSGLIVQGPSQVRAYADEVVVQQIESSMVRVRMAHAAATQAISDDTHDGEMSSLGPYRTEVENARSQLFLYLTRPGLENFASKVLDWETKVDDGLSDVTYKSYSSVDRWSRWQNVPAVPAAFTVTLTEGGNLALTHDTLDALAAVRAEGLHTGSDGEAWRRIAARLEVGELWMQNQLRQYGTEIKPASGSSLQVEPGSVVSGVQAAALQHITLMAGPTAGCTFTRNGRVWRSLNGCPSSAVQEAVADYTQELPAATNAAATANTIASNPSLASAGGNQTWTASWSQSAPGTGPAFAAGQCAAQGGVWAGDTCYVGANFSTPTQIRGAPHPEHQRWTVQLCAEGQCSPQPIEFACLPGGACTSTNTEQGSCPGTLGMQFSGDQVQLLVAGFHCSGVSIHIYGHGQADAPYPDAMRADGSGSLSYIAPSGHGAFDFTWKAQID